MKRLPRVCVIGAGCTGMTVSKALRDKGVPFDAYEKGSDVGGLWRFNNDNGMSSIYRSLHINTHRDRMEYRDFPMPDSYPDYPGHELIWQYFRSYVEKFDLDRYIHYNTAVVHCDRLPDGVWKVTLDNGAEKFYDAVVVANGHHWSPRYPEPAFPGKFKGEEVHAHHYIDEDHPIKMRGKNVLVVGMGNSAMDIAVELSRRGLAKNLYLSGRRGAYVWPKYIFGRPFDKLTELFPVWVPFWFKEFLASIVYRIAVGKMENYGLPKPEHSLGQAHPTISNEILGRLGSGDIKFKPNLQELKGKRISFVDGTEEDIDVIVWCTGYNVKFPFLDESLVAAKDNHIPLFQRMMKPGLPGLYFAGLLQPLGAVMPLSEAQGKLLAQLFAGEYLPPDEAQMLKEMERYERDMHKRYLSSPRHTIQVDFELYLHEIAKETKRGQARAERAGRKPAIEARADAYEDNARSASRAGRNGRGAGRTRAGRAVVRA